MFDFQQMGMTADGKFCAQCGQPIFAPRPGVTTPDEIRAFARTSAKYRGTSAERDGWIHPGYYCPNGCVEALVNIQRVIMTPC
jgi:hypothetical protein